MAGVGGAAATVLLAGDSHLAFVNRDRLNQLEALLPGTVAHNCAAGGSTSADLLRQAPGLARLAPAAVVVSVGTNDAMPARRVARERFREHLAEALDHFDGAARVCVGPPPAGPRFAAEGGPPDELLRAYHEDVRAACTAAGTAFVDAWAIFDPLRRAGTTYHVEDGVHLDDAGYDLLVRAIAAAVAAARTARGRS